MERLCWTCLDAGSDYQRLSSYITGLWDVEMRTVVGGQRHGIWLLPKINSNTVFQPLGKENKLEV